MKKLFILILLVITTLVLFSGAAACTSEPAPTSNLDESAVRSYADPATETTLQGLSEGNLEKYTQYGNAEFKAALTQETFDQTTTQINNQLGTYKSIEFLRTEEQEGFIIVHYKGNFEKRDVGIRMVFTKDQQIAGQWFE
jgi:hypothetical protein